MSNPNIPDTPDTPGTPQDDPANQDPTPEPSPIPEPVAQAEPTAQAPQDAAPQPEPSAPAQEQAAAIQVPEPKPELVTREPIAASPTPQPEPPASPAPQAAQPHEPQPAPPTEEPTATSPAPPRPNLWQTLSKATGYSQDLTPEQQITRRSFVSFSAFALLGIAGWKSWFWLKDAMHSDGVQSPLRSGLDVDDKIFKHTLSPNHLAKTWPREQAARNVRYNSPIGLGADPATWRLQVTKANGEMLSIGMDDLKALPKTDFAFEFKCIEGWSQVSWWGGVRFSDFIQHYNLQSETTRDYIGLSTPDDRYYVGVDTPSMMHPQTILAYEMTGQPLPPRHGAPLRLIIPIKYGVKNLKCIGKMFFSNTRPRDYWFERGYDYYCGL